MPHTRRCSSATAATWNAAKVLVPSTYIVMAYIVMAYMECRQGPCAVDLYSYGLYGYGLYGYGLHVVVPSTSPPGCSSPISASFISSEKGAINVETFLGRIHEPLELEHDALVVHGSGPYARHLS